MFKLQRQQVLDECIWEPGKGQLRYIEARTFGNSSTLTPDNYREGDLDDQDVKDWLQQRGRFHSPSNPLLGKEEGMIRLLICERRGFKTLGFGLSKSSLLAIEDEFGLPAEMLPLFKSHGGSYSHHFRPSASHGQNPEQLVITVKVPQMYQVANYGLCVTHSFKSHVTLGFMFGWNMISDENWKACMGGRECPKYLKPHGPRISNLIKLQIANWRHPLLLPVILVEDHIYNADRFKGFQLSPRTTSLEFQLRATKAGRNVGQSASLDFDGLSQNMASNRFKITTNINSAITDVITFGCTLKWDYRYCQFLRDISREVRDLSKTLDERGPKLDDDIKTLATLVASISEHNESLKARLDIQLNVLYNLVAQMDSNVNSKIAATTGLDSVAMKALAFVTTIFLPPTFIATLFSMSMFDWQADTNAQASIPDEKTKVVSRHFGIYWAISLPLTFVVLLTWRTWWHRKKNHYRQSYPHVSLDRNSGSSIFGRLSRMIWLQKDLEDVEKLA